MSPLLMKPKQKSYAYNATVLPNHTAVSEAVVTEMAQGAKDQAEVNISIAISGYGGPEGGEDGTPAGTVWFARILTIQLLQADNISTEIVRKY